MKDPTVYALTRKEYDSIMGMLHAVTDAISEVMYRRVSYHSGILEQIDKEAKVLRLSSEAMKDADPEPRDPLELF